MRVGFGFSSVTFRSRVFHSRVFSHPSVDTANRVARIFTKHSKCGDKFFVLTMSVRFDLLYYKQLLQYIHAVEIFH